MADIIYGIDFRTKQRDREKQLEALANEIMNECLVPLEEEQGSEKEPA